jgi:hypothetical protein
VPARACLATGAKSLVAFSSFWFSRHDDDGHVDATEFEAEDMHLHIIRAGTTSGLCHLCYIKTAPDKLSPLLDSRTEALIYKNLSSPYTFFFSVIVNKYIEFVLMSQLILPNCRIGTPIKMLKITP